MLLFRPTKDWSSEADRYKTAKQQAERLLEAREESHRQQVLRLENQVQRLLAEGGAQAF